jgi:hypothetical protein
VTTHTSEDKNIGIPSERELALAVLEAVKLWSNPWYSRFLRQLKPGELDEEWFKTFVGVWSVRRTIRRECLNKVRSYLDDDFRAAIRLNDPAGEVDVALQHLRKKRWPSKTRKDGSSSSPISLVSKVGFLFNPDRITPFDKLALAGLNWMRDKVPGGGEGHIGVEDYSSYLTAFDAMYDKFRATIKKETSRHWVSSVARQLGCEEKWLASKRFRRKVFDNSLVQIGTRSVPSISTRKRTPMNR